MEFTSLRQALSEVVKILKRFLYFKDPFSYLILGLFVLQTHCYEIFDAAPYILLNGPHASGKTLTLDLLNLLCHRSLLISQITKAGFFHVIHRLKGTLLLDEAENLSRRYQSEFDMAVLLHGYRKGGFVVRVDPRKRKPTKFKVYGPKVMANISGIYSRQLRSRCIIIKTTPIEGGD
ncbi:MAG: hypothetical protein HXY44_11935 [Syntrophaceae bacterium]|nr:hypothetical protein [Syntrophaceae bacterium]